MRPAPHAAGPLPATLATVGAVPVEHPAPVELDTPDGRVRGVRAGGVDRFTGVPYGAPPVGPRRFAAPERVRPWHGVRDATGPRTRAVQVVPRGLRTATRLAPGRRHGEDCLDVEVVAPLGAAAGVAAGAPGRPVLVWVHGGAYRSGSGADYDGAPLALLGDLVVVTVDYRLGAFGFLDLSDALGTAPDGRYAGNAGVRDVLAALEWVRRCVAAYGGDPDRVTLAGESAGAGIATSLLLVPRAAGLVHRVIAQSGPPSLNCTRVEAADAAREFLVALGAGAEDRDRLESARPREVLAAMARVDRLRPDGLPFRPWFDGDLLPESLEAAKTAPTLAVPLLIGTNRDEHRLFTVLRQAVLPLTRERIALLLVAEHGPERAARILARYPRDARGLSDLGTHGVFTMPSAALADRHSAVAPTYRYRLDYGSPRLGLGAFHALDLLLLFDGPAAVERVLLGRPDPRRAALADRIRRSWVSFARDGDPGGGWPRYAPPERLVRLLDLTDSVVSDPEGDRRAAWDGTELAVP